MAELWATFHSAREVLAVGAFGAFLVVLANAGAATLLAYGASLFVLAKAGAATLLATFASRSVLA